MQDSILPKDAHLPSPAPINLPTFTTPDMQVPSLAPHHLARPEMNLSPEFAPDRLLPDLQHPDLTVQMQDRPAELDPSALHVMHLDLTYQQLNQKTYPEVFMDQSGTNTTRSRHMDLLMRGLDAEEH